MSVHAAEEMSAVESGQMSVVETGQMTAVEAKPLLAQQFAWSPGLLLCFVFLIRPR